MTTSETTMRRILKLYFEAWRDKDTTKLVSLFNKDAVYRVKPFGLEEYIGLDKIRHYWDTHPVAMQIDPQPEVLQTAFAKDVCFAEWVNTFTTQSGMPKTTRGILLMEFRHGLIKELREHYLSMEGV